MSERKALIIFTLAMAANAGLVLWWLFFGDTLYGLPF